MKSRNSVGTAGEKETRSFPKVPLVRIDVALQLAKKTVA